MKDEILEPSQQGTRSKVTILFFFQEVKQKEVAKILNIGLPLVKYRIKRAKELLAGYLGKEELP